MTQATERDFMDIVFDDDISDEDADAEMVALLSRFPEGQAPDILGPGMFATQPPEAQPNDQANS